MTSPWSLLQREIFTPQEEKLLEMVHVWKSSRRKKISILCIIVSAFRPKQLFLVKLKKTDRGEMYKQAERWSLQDLKAVDGKDVIQVTPEFDLKFDKVYKWTASSYSQKRAFISCLWKLNQRHLSSRVLFVNIFACILEDCLILQEVGKRGLAAVPAEEDEYQEVTPKESADMLKQMEKYESLVANAAVFAERLIKDLQVLDEENLQTMISSEEQVMLLMGFVEEALEEVFRVERSLDVHVSMLGSMKQQMDHIQKGNSLLQLIDCNRQKLMHEVHFLTDKLDLSDENCQALHTCDCSSPEALRTCITAVDALHSCMSTQLKPGHRKLQAVAEQLIKFESLRQNFEKNFVSHITNIFQQQGTDQGSALVHQAGRLTSPKHTSYHQELLPYIPLMAWLKSSNAVIFNDLSKVYVQNLSKLYEKEIKAFFEVAKLLLGKSKEGRRFSLHEGLDRLSSSTTSLNKHYIRLSENTDEQLNELDQRNTVKVLEQVLMELEPMCRKEESFINSFFLLTDFRWLEDQQSKLSLKSDTDVSFAAKEAPNGLGDMAAFSLNEIFNCLEPELKIFVNICNKVSQFSCIQVLVTVNNCILKVQNYSEPSSLSTFFDCIISNILLLAKNSFSKYVFSLCKEIEEAKVPGKKKIGILPFINRFKDFVAFSEEVFRNAEQRRDLDKALGKLMDTVFNSINSLSTLKVNANMVIMENFHHIYCFLSEMKIHSLESKRKEAKQRYSEHLDKYVIKHLGQPLQKLNSFLDGIKACIAQGVKEEDVSFQMAYSKQELRKVIEKYPGKEVKKSVETLYGKILKHLSPEENLLPVVWHAMQQEFLHQYKEIEDMIRRCYPGSGVAIEFTVQDVLNYFITITPSYQ
uniref:Exocyst complex component 1-like n=1 Tax=Geotrypetes seraphini TaxID=260995 RepID=A0A6P8QVQ9_GEOSA|nr:exocyst complex component 1-like [Geotrypetes seraphini]